MRIYSKTGDKGSTSLIGGKRVSKAHLRIEAYGTVDELVAYIGLLRDQGVSQEIRDLLVTIQDKLMVCGSLLATDCKGCNSDLPKLYDTDITYLEKVIDEMDGELPPLHAFVLPGGHPTVSFCHIARSICRRTERYVVRLQEEEDVPELLVRYMNRLSDLLFVMARKLSDEMGILEILWQPKK